MTLAWAAADSIDDVLERMDAIDAALPHDDGVAYFNRMYRQVTHYVDAAVDKGFFQAGDFLERLDVHFGNLFFEAYAADREGRPVPPAWAPLFESRAKPRTHPIQFALAGMNAHICHDLPVAVITTCREAGVVPDDDTPEHHDFTLTNDVLGVAYPTVKSWFSTGVVATLDDAAGTVDDALARWGIETARAAAWGVARVMHGLHDNPRMLRVFADGHRAAVSLTSRGMLL
ncbi:DUF5995 family protein [Xylanimonas sp. McL0601]|uniref:DUF5995 family protein n=1 Tax=Xylanimonas sp. McL0601 TaxID=3414739 RepID=UPI003CE98F10